VVLGAQEKKVNTRSFAGEPIRRHCLVSANMNSGFEDGIRMHVNSLLRGHRNYFSRRGVYIRTQDLQQLADSMIQEASAATQLRTDAILSAQTNPHRRMVFPLNIGLSARRVAAPMPQQSLSEAELCVLYSGGIEYNAEESCAICQESIGVMSEENLHVEFNCTHRYHRTCIEQWLCTARSCPMCRADVDIVL
jgi:hypothetical protein